MVYTKYLTIYDNTKVKITNSPKEQRRNLTSENNLNDFKFSSSTSASSNNNKPASSSYYLPETYSNSTNNLASTNHSRTIFKVHASPVRNLNTTTSTSNIYNDNNHRSESFTTRKYYRNNMTNSYIDGINSTSPNNNNLNSYSSEFLTSFTNSAPKFSSKNVEIPIKRHDSGLRPYEYDHASPYYKHAHYGSTTTALPNDYYDYAKSYRSSMVNTATNTGNDESPTLQLDLEINTPKSDIKISRRCKSYEVSRVYISICFFFLFICILFA